MIEKMEDNKYYTPTIEEFHVGFEFELLEYTHEEPTGGWCWSIFGNLLINPQGGMYSTNLFDVIEWIKDEDVRVKYLDREDIESLGYTLKEELDWRHPKGPAFYFNKSKDSGDERMGYTNWSEIYVKFYTNSLPSIEVVKGRSGHESGVEGFEYKAFGGSLKNKSELKKLMAQLGI